MKKAIFIISMSLALVYCNTPQPATTTTDSDTSMNNATNMDQNQSTTIDTTNQGAMTDTTGTSTDSTHRQP